MKVRIQGQEQTTQGLWPTVAHFLDIPEVGREMNEEWEEVL